MKQLSLWVYGTITLLLTPFLKRKLHKRAKQEATYGHFISERFGRYQLPQSEGWIWIHAVSLGETRAAAILLRELRRLQPHFKYLLTHGTSSGRLEGIKLLTPTDIQVWQPWDTRDATQKFLHHFRPRIGILMETEVWPQLCESARLNGIPLILANARLSEKSLNRIGQLTSLMRPAFQSFREIWAQTSNDASRLYKAGGQQIQILGNLKFDLEIQSGLIERGIAIRQAMHKPIIVLASSREGEEKLFLDALRHLASTSHQEDYFSTDSIQWLIVPRHPQRFSDVAQFCEQSGFTVSRRSQWGAAPQTAQIWIGDSVGEMPMYYGMSSLALLGGSFEPLGGQNLIESIACGCPVIMGPHTYNFAQACVDAQSLGVADRVESMSQALVNAHSLAKNAPRLQAMRNAAKSWLHESRGAAERMAKQVISILDAAAQHTQT